MGPCASRSFTGAHSVVVVSDRKCQDDYSFGKKIGEGAQGVVFEAMHNCTNERVAIKRTHAGPFASGAGIEAALTEVELLRLCHHPNVIKVLAAYQSSTDVHVVLEHVDGFQLVKYLVELDKEEEAGRPHNDITMEKILVLRQLIDAVAHVHSRGVIFRDLKPANVLVSRAKPRRVKLIDFGRAAHMKRNDRREHTETPTGTSLYMAPEVESRSMYGQQSDMWGVGVIMYLVLSGKMPFEHSVSGLYRVLLGQYEPFDDSFSSQAKDLISRLLVVDPDRRLNAPQCAQHSFFSRSGAAAAAFVATKLPRRVRASHSTLHALTVHDEILKQTAVLLAQNLDDDDLLTVRNWVEMSAEAAEDSVRSESKSSIVPGITALMVARGENDRGEDERRNSLEKLYMEMRDVGEASVKIRANTSLERSTNDGTDISVVGSSFRGSHFLRSGGLINIAHKHGLCSLDELIAACTSSGCNTLAETVENVKAQLCKQRVSSLVKAGVKSTDRSNALLDTMLFRYKDLFAKAVTLREELFHSEANVRESAGSLSDNETHEQECRLARAGEGM